MGSRGGGGRGAGGGRGTRAAGGGGGGTATATTPGAPVATHGDPSPEHVAAVQAIVDALPAPVRDLIASQGVQVVAASSLTGIATAENQNATGVYDTRTGRVAVPEFVRDPGGTYFQLDATPRGNVARHEVGHAVDYALAARSGGLYYSQNPDFNAAYQRDVARLSRADRQQFSYYLQPGNLGAREAFAEAFAATHGGGPAGRAAFQRAFPNTTAHVQQAMANL
jgi:hypothetical protein